MQKILATEVCHAAAVFDLSDADLDAVGAAGSSHGALVSIGNIAIGFQFNNQINVAVLSAQVFQGGTQSNFVNSGIVIFANHF